MRLTAPANANYAATVVRVARITPLANCDNVVAVPVLGYQAIVSKDTQVGDLGIVFTAETQLAVEYASENNLHRHSDLNTDPSAKGYLEDNRRIKALKFRGHRSDALFMPLTSLAYLGIDVSLLNEGDTFDQLDGHEICRKYVIQRFGRSGVPVAKVGRPSRVDERMFPKHFDTGNYFREAATFDGNEVVVTQKLHGTSVRIGHVPVGRKLNWLERLAKRIGVKVQETEYAYVYGSRNVVKDPGGEDPGFYGQDLYTQVGSRLEGLLPKGFIVYGEIVGWVPGTGQPIQRGYTYNVPEGSAWLFVYRVVQIGEGGYPVDLSWTAVKEFCDRAGLEAVPELCTMIPSEGSVQVLLDKKMADLFPWSDALPTAGNLVDEGVCLRQEGITPRVAKAKSPEFFRWESAQLDLGEVDMETAEAEPVPA